MTSNEAASWLLSFSSNWNHTPLALNLWSRARASCDLSTHSWPAHRFLLSDKPRYLFVTQRPRCLQFWREPSRFHFLPITLRGHTNGWWPARRFDVWPVQMQTHTRRSGCTGVVVEDVRRVSDNYSYQLNNNEQHAVDRLTCMLERVCAGMAGRHETESRVWVPALTHPVIRLMQQQS